MRVAFAFTGLPSTQARSTCPPPVCRPPSCVADSGTPHTAKNWPRLNDSTVGDSTCSTPVVSCVCSGEMKPPPGSMPMFAGTVSLRPRTKMSRCWWMCSAWPSAPSAGRPILRSRSCNWLAPAFHGGPCWAPGSAAMPVNAGPSVTPAPSPPVVVLSAEPPPPQPASRPTISARGRRRTPPTLAAHDALAPTAHDPVDLVGEDDVRARPATDAVARPVDDVDAVVARAAADAVVAEAAPDAVVPRPTAQDVVAAVAGEPVAARAAAQAVVARAPGEHVAPRSAAHPVVALLALEHVVARLPE